MGILTPQQRLFVNRLSQRTGLDSRVIAAWTLAEESGRPAQQRAAQGNNNWLNIGYFDSGPGAITRNKVFRDPASAADATARFLQGSFGGASPGIRRILSARRQGPSGQIQAIASSGWASSGYNGGSTLRQLYHQVGGVAPTGGQPAAPMSTSTTTTTPGVNNAPTRKRLLASYLLGQAGYTVPGQQQGDPYGQSLVNTVIGIAKAKDVPAKTVTTSAPSSGGGGGSLGGIYRRQNLGRTDQGIDITGSGPIPAVFSGRVTRVVPHGGGSGWPGGGFVVIQLDQPVRVNGRLVRHYYVAENIAPRVRPGQRVQRGQTIATALGGYPFTEQGFAADSHGTTLARATTGYREGQVTPAGQAFKPYLGL